MGVVGVLGGGSGRRSGIYGGGNLVDLVWWFVLLCSNCFVKWLCGHCCRLM